MSVDNTVSQGISSLNSSLSWLQGILYRARSLGFLPNLMLFLLGIFEGKDAGSLSTKNTSKSLDVSTLPNQKWLIRRRDHTGKLRHLATFDHEPSDAELEKFGPGSYSILTTKPHLQGCKSVVIKDKGASAPTKRILKPAVAEKAPERSLNGVRQAGPKIPLTERYDRVSDKEPERKVIIKRPAKPLVQPHLEPKEVLGDLTKELQKPTVAEVAEPIEKVSKETSFASPKPEESRPKEVCARCLEPSSSMITCDYCGQRLCRGFTKNCYEEHECSNSKLCYKCGRRVPNEIAEIADLCHRYFCSPKCMNECRMKNLMKIGCMGCNVESNTEKEEKEADEEMEERDGCEGESPEEDEPDEEDVEEMCGGVPKRIACKRCQKDNCQGRFCDGYCDKCHFHCEARCENGGECKFCPDFDDCEIRCKEAPDRCDRRHCRGFRCQDRTLSGADCDGLCGQCDDRGCYSWGRQENGDYQEED